MVEPHVVGEEVGDTSFEAVELGQCVVPDRQQDADAQAGARTSSGSSSAKPACSEW